MTIAAEFAKTRYTLGVPISTLQGISHPLANIAITVQGGRNLARRAAWFLDNEPDERPELAPSAFVFMAEEASKAATMAVHVQGGLGVSAEAAATRISGACPRVAAGRRRPRRHREAHRRDRRRPRKRHRNRSHRWISHGLSCPTTTRPSCDEARDFLRDTRHRRGHAARPRDRRQLRRGCAPGARRRGLSGQGVEAGIRGRLQPGAAAHLGAGEAAGARAVGDVGHHRDDRAVGGEVRLTGSSRPR